MRPHEARRARPAAPSHAERESRRPSHRRAHEAAEGEHQGQLLRCSKSDWNRAPCGLESSGQENISRCMAPLRTHDTTLRAHILTLTRSETTAVMCGPTSLGEVGVLPPHHGKGQQPLEKIGGMGLAVTRDIPCRMVRWRSSPCQRRRAQHVRRATLLRRRRERPSRQRRCSQASSCARTRRPARPRL